jgi:hypothetical protein
MISIQLSTKYVFSQNIYAKRNSNIHIRRKIILEDFFLQLTLHYFLIDSCASVSLLRQIIFHLSCAMQLFLFFVWRIYESADGAEKEYSVCCKRAEGKSQRFFFNRVTAALILGVGMEWVGECGCGSGCQYGCRCRCGCGYGCVVVSIDVSNHFNLTLAP